MLQPDSIIRKSEDTRYRYSKQRPMLEVIGNAVWEVEHYLDHDILQTFLLVATLRSERTHPVLVVNLYPRGEGKWFWHFLYKMLNHMQRGGKLFLDAIVLKTLPDGVTVYQYPDGSHRRYDLNGNVAVPQQARIR